MEKTETCVLLIEDSLPQVRLVDQMLRELEDVSFELEHASRLGLGLERLKAGGIDAVLLDLGLPDSDGLDTLDRIRQDHPATPVVVLTQIEDYGLGTESVRRGAQDYLPKTITSGELLARSIQCAIERQSLASDLNQTQQRKIHQKERLNRQLEAQNRELEEFAYMASHDLQEPLRKIIAFCGLLERDLPSEPSPKVRRDLEHISGAARRMQRLVQDLLDLSRASRTELKRSAISLDACVNDALDVLQMRIESSGARVERSPLPDIWGDRVRITQLYQNLIGNALKFVKGRTPLVRLTAQQENGEWVFGVCDNGIGVETKYAEQIFGAFQRLHSRSEYDGSGIGLAICRRTVERHGGRIWVESAQGQGSHFRFTLPQRKKTRAQDEPKLEDREPAEAGGRVAVTADR